MTLESAQGEGTPKPEIKFENGLLSVKMNLQCAVMNSMLGTSVKIEDHDEQNRLRNSWIDEFSDGFKILFVQSIEQDSEFASKLNTSKVFFDATIKQYEAILQSSSDSKE